MERINRVRDTYSEVQRLLRKVDELENLATHITPILSDMPKGKSSQPKDDAWARLIDYKMLCSAKIDEYVSYSAELEDELSCIRNRNIRTAMQYYYVDCCKQTDIAKMMSYSDREIRYFLQKGRRIYQEVYHDD